MPLYSLVYWQYNHTLVVWKGLNGWDDYDHIVAASKKCDTSFRKKTHPSNNKVLNNSSHCSHKVQFFIEYGVNQFDGIRFQTLQLRILILPGLNNIMSRDVATAIT